MNSVPRLSVVIPARDEERELPHCLEAIRDSAAGLAVNLEIVVVNNRSTDRTAEIAEAAGCVVVADDSKNLSAIRNRGVRASRGDLVITIDADSRMSRGMIAAVLQSLADPRVVGGGVMILPERYSLGILCTGMALLPLALWYRISAGLFYFRRADFDAISGFDEALVSVEDIDFARRLRAHGRATKRRFKTIFSAHIVTSCRKFDRLGDWYFLRNFRQSLELLRGTNQDIANTIWYDFRR